MTHTYEAHVRTATDLLLAAMGEARASEGGQWVASTSRVLPQLDADMQASAGRKLHALLSRDLPHDAETLAALRHAITAALEARGYTVLAVDSFPDDPRATCDLDPEKKAVTVAAGTPSGATDETGPLCELLASALATDVLVSELPREILSSREAMLLIRRQAQAAVWIALRDAGIDAVNIPATLAYGEGIDLLDGEVRTWVPDLAECYEALMNLLRLHSGGRFGTIPAGAAQDAPTWTDADPGRPVAGQAFTPPSAQGSPGPSDPIGRLFDSMERAANGNGSGGGYGVPSGPASLPYGPAIEAVLRGWMGGTDALIGAIMQESERLADKAQRGTIDDDDAGKAFLLTHLSLSVANAEMIVKAAVRAALLGEQLMREDRDGNDDEKGENGHAA